MNQTIDIVIPFRNSPRTNNQELRFALRGFATYLSGTRDVWIIGEVPESGMFKEDAFKFIPYVETNWFTSLTRNIYEKLLIACKDNRISDPFLYCNDDHFLLKPFDAITFPLHHKGKDFAGKGKYEVTVRNTTDLYTPKIYNYDTHCPIVIYKYQFLKNVASLNWARAFGYLIKTCYIMGDTANMFSLPGEYYPDLKLDHAPTEDDFLKVLQRHYFSCGDKFVTRAAMPFFKSLYPNKSKYEL